MAGTASKASGYCVPSAALLLFTIVTFAITWGIVGFYVIRPDTAFAWFGEITGSHPAFILATWAPAVAAFIVVLRHGRIAGLKAFLSRLTLWRCSIGWAAFLLIGATWGLWHLPAFYLSGTVFSSWGFAPFFVGNVSLAVIVTPLFNSTRGSILLPALFHYQLINPLWPDAQPYDTYFFVLVAVAIVWLNRATMFAKTDAVTAVIPTNC